MSEDVGDSIRAAERLFKSPRLHAILGLAWKILAPFAGIAVGWIISRAQLSTRMDEQDLVIKTMAENVAKIALDVQSNRIARERADKATGRYAAFAVASSQAYETPKVKAQKRSYAEDYARSFERMYDDGTPVDVALMKLFKDVALP